MLRQIFISDSIFYVCGNTDTRTASHSYYIWYSFNPGAKLWFLLANLVLSVRLTRVLYDDVLL